MTSRITSKQKVELDRRIARARKRAEKGKTSEDIQRVFERGGEFEEEYVALFNRFTAKSPDYTLARSILGGDFIAPEEVMAARSGVVYTSEQIAQLADMMPSEEALRWCKDNGFAVVAAPPHALSLLGVRALEPDLFCSKTGDWCAEANQKSASGDKTSFGWLMIRKAEVLGSLGRKWTEQSGLLSEVEYVPNVAELAWFVTTFFKVRGVHLFKDVFVRTNSVGANCGRVYLGFDAGCLDVGPGWDDDRDGSLGVASGRKVG